LKRSAENAGYDKSLFAFHSFRAGFICSALLQAGIFANASFFLIFILKVRLTRRLFWKTLGLSLAGSQVFVVVVVLIVAFVVIVVVAVVFGVLVGSCWLV
jgi:hypothetical protein